jgi:hypothetical protein
LLNKVKQPMKKRRKWRDVAALGAPQASKAKSLWRRCEQHPIHKIAKRYQVHASQVTE